MGSKYNDTEKTLLEVKTQMLVAMGSTPSEARREAEEELDAAIAQSQKEGTYYLPTNFGDIILGNALSDEPNVMKFATIIRKNLTKKRAEGVRDEDIKLWWNLHDVERHMSQMDDNAIRAAFMLGAVRESTRKTSDEVTEEAIAKARKAFPLYGNPEDTSNATGDDRPLPYELKDRINRYIEKRRLRDPEQYRQDIQRSSSFNALVRKEIRASNL